MPDFTRPKLPDLPVYRAYSVGMSGAFFACDVVEADSDANAIIKAQAMRSLFPLDLWDRARFLGRFEPEAVVPR